MDNHKYTLYYLLIVLSILAGGGSDDSIAGAEAPGEGAAGVGPLGVEDALVCFDGGGDGGVIGNGANWVGEVQCAGIALLRALAEELVRFDLDVTSMAISCPAPSASAIS